LKILSFRISGAFAAFRDPSITTSQTVYYIPSKSAVIGLLGALIGIRRSDKLGELYSEEYLEFFKNTYIGMQFESTPKKIVYFTNHRSLKEPKTKPFKTEVVENPRYTIYVNTNNDQIEKLFTAFTKNEFTFSPYLGHAYCPASVCDVKIIDAKVVDSEEEKTRCVVLDESETYNPDFEFKGEVISEGSVIIERHVHHFFDKDGKLDGRVLKHWIPTCGVEFEIKRDSKRDLSKFYKIGDQVVCMY
jgi:CRISPR-associated protein Cas5h